MAAAAPSDVPSVLAALWKLWSSYEGVKSIVKFLPENEFINLGKKWREAQNSRLCVIRELDDAQCKREVLDVRSLGDEAAVFGGKLEMWIALVVFVVYPVYVLFSKRKTPSVHQLAVLVLAVCAWAASTYARVQFSYASPPNGPTEQRCVGVCSIVVALVLALAMWSALPTHDLITEVLARRLDDIRDLLGLLQTQQQQQQQLLQQQQMQIQQQQQPYSSHAAAEDEADRRELFKGARAAEPPSLLTPAARKRR